MFLFWVFALWSVCVLGVHQNAILWLWKTLVCHRVHLSIMNLSASRYYGASLCIVRHILSVLRQDCEFGSGWMFVVYFYHTWVNLWCTARLCILGKFLHCGIYLCVRGHVLMLQGLAIVGQVCSLYYEALL